MEKYRCHVCTKLINEDEGVTTIDGSWVCDSDSCRTLDSETNEATAKRLVVKRETEKVKELTEIIISMAITMEEKGIDCSDVELELNNIFSDEEDEDGNHFNAYLTRSGIH